MHHKILHKELLLDATTMNHMFFNLCFDSEMKFHVTVNHNKSIVFVQEREE